MSRATLFLGLILLAGCATEPGDLQAPPAPEIGGAAAVAGTANVLSALVTVRVRQADSVLVRFGTLPVAALDSATPAVRVEGDSALVPVLGLLPAVSYELRAWAFGPGGTTQSDPLQVTTGALPADLPSYTAGGLDPSPGYVVFAAGGYGLAIDNSGRVVWYTRLADPATLNFQAQPTGRYYTRPTTSASPVPWLEIDPLGQVTGTLGCARGLVPRFHDLIVLTDGTSWMMGDEARTLDLSALGGVAGARVTGTVVQHLDRGGTLLFEWNPFDHFSIEDLDPADRAGPAVNWTHGNALELDADGNLLVSFRSLSEITSIDPRTGAVRWRFGGRANQLAGPAEPPFVGQHGLRVTGPGRLVLLDNRGEGAGSRVEHYRLDPAARTARLESYTAADPPTVASLGGTTQPLPGGRVLAAFGNGARVEEIDASGAVVWRIQGDAGYVFRAQRIRSLYAPGAELPR